MTNPQHRIHPGADVSANKTIKCRFQQNCHQLTNLGGNRLVQTVGSV